MFPCFDEVVSAVPDHDRYPTLEELEKSSDQFAAAHPDIDVWQAGVSRSKTIGSAYSTTG